MLWVPELIACPVCWQCLSECCMPSSPSSSWACSASRGWKTRWVLWVPYVAAYPAG